MVPKDPKKKDDDDVKPVYDGPSGERVGHTHETYQEQLELGDHTWHRENADGTETEEHYHTDESNW